MRRAYYFLVSIWAFALVMEKAPHMGNKLFFWIGGHSFHITDYNIAYSSTNLGRFGRIFWAGRNTRLSRVCTTCSQILLIILPWILFQKSQIIHVIYPRSIHSDGPMLEKLYTKGLLSRLKIKQLEMRAIYKWNPSFVHALYSSIFRHTRDVIIQALLGVHFFPRI